MSLESRAISSPVEHYNWTISAGKMFTSPQRRVSPGRAGSSSVSLVKMAFQISYRQMSGYRTLLKGMAAGRRIGSLFSPS